MKRLAVWLLVMMCFFGSCQLYAAPSKFDSAGRAIGYLIRQSTRHNWPQWVVWLLVVAGLLCFVGWVAEYFDDKKKIQETRNKRLVGDHNEKGIIRRKN